MVSDHDCPLAGRQRTAEQPTLRDRFAMAALQGMLAGGSQPTDPALIGCAYRVADAMLRAREPQEPTP